MAARANLRRSPSSSPETPRTRARNIDSGDHRNNQDPFRDILDDEPVLPMSNLRTRNEPDEDSQDNTSTAATFAGYGRDNREEGTGDHSSDSSGSSMRDAWFGRPPTRGFIRPRSYVLRDEAYVGLTDLRNAHPNNTNHICQECKNGSRCWCPIREESPNTNGRGPRSRRLDRCRTCGKMYVIIGNSRQWCCQDWVSSSITHILARQEAHLRIDKITATTGPILPKSGFLLGTSHRTRKSTSRNTQKPKHRNILKNM